MNLSDMGEEALIEHIVKNNLLPSSGLGLVVGVGDDAAVLSQGADGMLTIVTTDMLTEGIDFRLDMIRPRQLGWKSVAANISDIAAMGGEPTWTFVSLGLRPDADVEFVDELYLGMKECAGKYGSSIAGGDMNSVSGDYVISIMQLGRVEPDMLAVRSGALPGDKIFVTGNLGDSCGGLELLLKYGLEEASRVSPNLVEAHLTPVPRVSESRTAVKTRAVHAMMDLSDGLGADLPKLCRASDVGALIYSEELPISADLRNAGKTLCINPVSLAAGGGEDFELLMTVPPEDGNLVKEAVENKTNTSLTEIGEIVGGNKVEIVFPDGVRKPLSGGWEHFS